MKKIKCVVLGYGHRGSCYAEYAQNNPEELEVIAVIDPDKLKQAKAKKDFRLGDEMIFDSLDAFMGKNISCDFVINATMDELHYSTMIKLLNAKYDVLMEKPVTNNAEELLEINDLANKNGCKVIVCHVLRYTLFYSEIKKIIDSGELGKIVNMQLNEHVGKLHFLKAFVRGKWRSESQCGSGLLLQKCCHDTDLICWLNNITVPEEVYSMGERAFFVPENAPDGATQFCFECPNKEDCLFNAEKTEIEHDSIPYYTWAGIGKQLNDITEQDKLDYLKHDIFGQCVYKIKDMDIVDRQSLMVKFKNKSIATLNVVGGATLAGRHIHILFEKGEIIGYIEQNKFRVIKKLGFGDEFVEEVVDLDNILKLNGTENSITGHYGSDYYIMRDLVKYYQSDKKDVITSSLDDSINGHLLCFAAEKSRKENKNIKI